MLSRLAFVCLLAVRGRVACATQLVQQGAVLASGSAQTSALTVDAEAREEKLRECFVMPARLIVSVIVGSSMPATWNH